LSPINDRYAVLRFRPRSPLIWLYLAISTATLAGESPSAPSLLIRDVSVIDVRSGVVWPHRTVRTAAGRIVAIVDATATARAPGKVDIVDGRGKFLLPGFIDMHAHLNSRLEARAQSPALTLSDGDILSADHLSLFIYSGVTTIQVMHGDEGMLALRDDVEQGRVVGPRLVVGSPRLDGNPPASAYPRIVATAAEGTAVIDEMHHSGYDFIKIYDNLDQPTYDAIVTRAHQYQMRVDGHLPRHLPLEHALGGMQDHIAHVEEFVGYAGNDSTSDIEHITELMKKSGIGVTPTLIAFKNVLRSVSDLPGLLADPISAYADPVVYHSWVADRNIYQADRFQNPHTQAALVKRFELMRRITGEFARAGVPLVVGSDCTVSGTVAGFSFHDEVVELARLGISSSDLLRMATLNAATALRMEAELGTVEVGKRADLVLLAANPLDDVANTRRIEGVVLSGRWYPQSQLRGRLATAMRNFAALDRRMGLTLKRPVLISTNAGRR
jgi:hypothetical protein